MSLFFSETGKTDRRLTTLVVLLRQLDSEFGDDISSITLKGGVEGTVTIYNDESERWFTDEEFLFELI